MIDQDIDQFLAASTPAAKFEFGVTGVVYKGKVVAARTRHQQAYGTGELLYWDKEKQQPKIELLVDIQTDQRDTPDDDGIRRIYARGQMITAIRKALQDAKSKLEIGGTLAVKYYGNGEPSTPGYKPPMLYQAKYEPAAPPALNEEDF